MKEKNRLNKRVLWGVSVSPYVRKVIVALEEKQLDYHHHEILPSALLNALGEEVPKDFSRVSVMGKIPVFEDNDFSICESAIITDYLDREYEGSTRLYPIDNKQNVLSRWFESYADNVLAEATYTLFFEKVVKPQVLLKPTSDQLVDSMLKDKLPGNLRYLNSVLESTDYFAGKIFSMADAAVAIQLLSLKLSGFIDVLQDYPSLKNHFEKIISRPSFNSFIN